MNDLWESGIPVVPLEVIPAPNFQGLACIVDDNPVILLGQRYDELGRVAFLVAHEAGHIAAKDCSPGVPVVDEEDVRDDEEIEVRADQYAVRTLVGEGEIPQIHGEDFKELATQAIQLERQTGADASQIIFAWAARSGEYALATLAVKAINRGNGARVKLRRLFDDYIDIDNASDSDRALLRCVYGDPDRNEDSH